MKYNYTDLVKFKQAAKEKKDKSIILSTEKLDKIKDSVDTEIIKYKDLGPYEDINKCFTYVDEKFPKAYVKSVFIYRCPHYILKKVGYGYAAGFYDIANRAVVISKDSNESIAVKKKSSSPFDTIKGRFDEDDIIVHELLHYAHHAMGYMSKSMHIEEEFAYGNSAGYLRAKGYSDEKIIRENFMPYLIGTVDVKEIALNEFTSNNIFINNEKEYKKYFKKFENEIFNKSVSEAFLKGRKIISYHADGKPIYFEKDDGIRKTRMELLDLD